MVHRFADRFDAGQRLGQALAAYRERSDVLVLGLPRGGVPVAYEVARALDASLDVLVVRKLGVPGHRELALGAIASGGLCVLNEDVVSAIGISRPGIERIIEEERLEIRRRENLFRGTRPVPAIRDRCIILVDDGIATGATMRAALRLVRSQGPRRLVAAAPVAAMETVETLRAECDEVVCLMQPAGFRSVGQWYADFTQTGDQEVRDLLDRRARELSSNDDDSGMKTPE